MKYFGQIVFVYLFSLAAVNAAASDLLSLTGASPLVNQLQVLPTQKASSLDIIQGESNAIVASVQEISNDRKGYKIEMSSQRGGRLVHQLNSSNFSTYKISYNNGSYRTPSTSAHTVKTISFLGALTTNTSVVKIRLTAKPQAQSGIYSDTLTFSIVAL